jgi:hypothetical protein
MNAWPTLLRVVLSIALILNGIGGAVAGTRMQAGQLAASTGAPSAEAGKGADMPCHAHQRPESGGHQASKEGSPALPGKAPVPDCCKSGMCTCACVHVAQIALSALQVTAPVLEHDLAVRRLSLTYATPSLPHLIRPPIG